MIPTIRRAPGFQTGRQCLLLLRRETSADATPATCETGEMHKVEPFSVAEHGQPSAQRVLWHLLLQSHQPLDTEDCVVEVRLVSTIKKPAIRVHSRADKLRDQISRITE